MNAGYNTLKKNKMDITTIILAAVASLTSAILTSIFSHWLMLRRLRQEMAHKNRTLYLEKHIEACTKFWALLAPTSNYSGDNRVLCTKDDKQYLNIKATQFFCENITDFFFSEHGIFMSRDFRKALFDTRDYLESLIAEESPESNLGMISLSKSKMKKVEACFRWLRETTRDEIVVKNLKFSEQEVSIGSSKSHS